MNIDGVRNGIVIDHIAAGRSMEIYHYLQLDRLDSCVAIIKNVRSTKYGKKDIIKIDEIIDVDLNVLGYLDPHITVNIVRDEKVMKKMKLEPPQELKNILKCKNPRCITTTEQEIDQIFRLVDKESCAYRCIYCEAPAKGGD
ncbi:MAG: aspartate carbamoyltransferase regulatory subunit [Oscillospiraceae bacterium]|jgi:aspartate carbamoyltransferase regulatory subunit